LIGHDFIPDKQSGDSQERQGWKIKSRWETQQLRSSRLLCVSAGSLNRLELGFLLPSKVVNPRIGAIIPGSFTGYEL